jgi:hypothetical protein
MDTTPNLDLPYLMAAQAQKHVTHNEALRSLDAIVQLSVLDKDLAAPPGSPAEGDAYIVAAAPTGAWTGQAGKVAAWQDGAWAFYTPREGWLAWVADENTIYAYDGSAWAIGVALWGINATPDTTNRLALSSPASLFNHAGGGHQQKINKATAADTASQLFQTNFSGRAEYGLTGDDDFHVKVSPDGSSWQEALVIDKDDATADFKKALRAQDHLIGQQATGPRFVAVGDSHTTGFGASAPYTALISYPTWNGQAFTVSNIGVNGRRLLEMSRLAYANLNPLYANESGLNVAVVWGGANDIAADGATPATVYSYLRAFASRLRALGWRVIVCTLISRHTTDASNAAFNGFVRANWPLFADALADLGANASIGAGTGNYANTTYFQADQEHLKDAGLEIVADLVEAQLVTLAQGTPNFLPPFGNAALGGARPNNARLLVSRNAAATIPDGESNNAFHVAGADGQGTTLTFDAFGGVVQIQGRRSQGTVASPSALQAENIILTLAGRGYGATGYAASARGFLAHVAAENWTDTAQGTHWDIYTTPNGTTGIGTRRLRVTQAGDVMVGSGASPVCKLDVDGAMRVKSYTVATLPSAAAGAGQMIYVSDETGGAVLAFSDGTSWRRVTDRAVVS